MAFNVTCSPGKDADVAFVQVTEHMPALVLYLDPVNLAIQMPTFPGGTVVLADFCRQLAREAAKFATAIDPDGDPAPPENTGPRHALARDEISDSGAGH